MTGTIPPGLPSPFRKHAQPFLLVQPSIAIPLRLPLPFRRQRPTSWMPIPACCNPSRASPTIQNVEALARVLAQRVIAIPLGLPPTIQTPGHRRLPIAGERLQSLSGFPSLFGVADARPVTFAGVLQALSGFPFGTCTRPSLGSWKWRNNPSWASLTFSALPTDFEPGSLDLSQPLSGFPSLFGDILTMGTSQHFVSQSLSGSPFLSDNSLRDNYLHSWRVATPLGLLLPFRPCFCLP